MSAEVAFAEIVAALTRGGQATVGRMMRSDGLKASGKFFAFLSGDNLVLKLPASTVDDLVRTGRASRYSPRPGTPMREWAQIPFDSARNDWQSLTELAHRHVSH